MKTFKILTHIVFLILVLVSCTKDEIEINENKFILLEIEPGENSYIGENNQPFYSNAFLSISDTTLYQLKVESGNKYNIFCTQPDQNYPHVKLVLLNSDKDTISYSNNYDGKANIYYNSNITGEVYLSIFLDSKYNESLTYNLYFEKISSKQFNFKNYQWEYTGNWEIINSETLEFKCNDSRKFRYLKLVSSFENHTEFSFIIKSSTKHDLPSFGFLGNGSNSLSNWGDFKNQLPSTGKFFNIVNNSGYRIVHFVETGYGIDYGNFNIPDLDLSKGIKLKIKEMENAQPKSYVIYMNDVFLNYFSIDMFNKFYLIIEDRGFESYTIENLHFE